MDRDRDRRPAPPYGIPPEDRFMGGRGQSYRPGGARDRSPPPRGDRYRTRSPPPRRSDLGGGGDSYRGPPRSPPRRDTYRRRSPSPPPRFRDRDVRGADTYRSRPRSPLPRRDELPRDDLFRRESIRDSRDDRGYRDDGGYGRDERSRGYGGARSPPPRYRDHSPPPLKRVREPSPISSRGRRSPPPPKRERLTSPPGRGRYHDHLPQKSQNTPPRRFSPPPRDRPLIRGQQTPVRSPAIRNERNEGAEERKRLISTSPQRGVKPDERGDGRTSGTASRRSSPPIHPSRLIHQQPAESSVARPRDAPEHRDVLPLGKAPNRRSATPVASREPSRPAENTVASSSEQPQTVAPLSHEISTVETAAPTPRQPPTGPAGQRGPPSTMAPPTGAAPVVAPSAPNVRGTSVPPAGPRGGSGPSRGEPSSLRGRGSFRGNDFSSRGALATPIRGGRGGPGSTTGTGRGASGPTSSPFEREGEFAPAPPSGPRSSSISLGTPVSSRQNMNATAATLPRNQRFGPGGPPPPEPSTPIGPRGFQRRPTEPNIFAESRQTPGVHPAIANLPKRKEGGERLPPVLDRTKLDRLGEEAEKLRKAIEEKETKKRRSLREWDRLTRETTAAAFRTQIAEDALRYVSGDAESTAAF